MSKAHAMKVATYQKRLPQHIDYRYDITRYDDDNLYPQKIEELRDRSPNTQSAVSAKADFLNGDGFSENQDFVINEEGQTITDILLHCSSEFATIPGIALHLNVNLLGEIVEITPMEFKTVRFSAPDENGEHDSVKVSINWEGDGKKLPIGNLTKVKEYPIWPMNREDAIQIIRDFDGDFEEEFPGFVYYWTPVKDQYPRASFDSVIDSAQADSEIQVFELGSIQNGFLGAGIFRYPGKFESQKEKEDFLNDLRAIKGPQNANSILMVETPEDFDNPLFDSIAANNNDTLFQETNKNVRNRIVQAFKMPKAILGIMPETGIFNQQEIEDSYIYYNLMTKRERMILEKMMNHLAENFIQPFSVGEILEQSFGVNVEEEELEIVEDGEDTNTAE